MKLFFMAAAIWFTDMGEKRKNESKFWLIKSLPHKVVNHELSWILNFWSIESLEHNKKVCIPDVKKKNT